MTLPNTGASKGSVAVTTPNDFIDYFRARHNWWCKPRSVIHKDLTAFAQEQADSPDTLDELYLIFCTLHGIRPKPEAPEAG